MAKGYFNDASSTGDSFKVRDDLDGRVWYNTGDIVEYCPVLEYLNVIDRMKNIVKLANAMFICPERLENIYVGNLFVENVFVYAEGTFSSIVCVVIPNRDSFLALASSMAILPPSSPSSSSSLETKEEFSSISPETYREICSNPKIVLHILRSLQSFGKERDIKPYEILTHLILEDEKWSIDNQLLTPSFKFALLVQFSPFFFLTYFLPKIIRLSRPKLKFHYRDRIRSLYFGSNSSPSSLPSSSSSSSPSPASPSLSPFPVSSFPPALEPVIAFLEGLTNHPIEEIKETPFQEMGIDSVNLLQLSSLIKKILPTLSLEKVFSLRLFDLISLLEKSSSHDPQPFDSTFPPPSLKPIINFIEGLTNQPYEEIKETAFQEMGIDSVNMLQLSFLIKKATPPLPSLTLENVYSLRLVDLVSFLDHSSLTPLPSESEGGEKIVDWDAETTLPEEITTALSDKTFPSYLPTEERRKFSVFLTGATGFLGCHILKDLLECPSVEIVYCLVRATSESGSRSLETSASSEEQNILDRILSAFRRYGFLKTPPFSSSSSSSSSHHTLPLSKIQVVTGSLSKNQFGLTKDRFCELAKSIDIIIHNGDFSFSFLLPLLPF